MIGDVGIHAKVAPDFWAAVVARMTADFRARRPDGRPRCRRGIAGECARDGVSTGAGDANELTDSVTVE